MECSSKVITYHSVYTLRTSALSAEYLLLQLLNIFFCNFLKKYLQSYHYISSTRSGNHDFTTAVRHFQHFMNLPVTGDVDRATLNMMRKPRCGVPDVEDGTFNTRKRRFSVFGSKWSKTHLTYYLQHGQDLPRATQERVIERALQYWSEVSPLTFSRIGDANQADLKMR